MKTNKRITKKAKNELKEDFKTESFRKIKLSQGKEEMIKASKVS